MTVGLIGRKCGMTRIFMTDGESVPVTVIEVEPNRITQVKTVENDGYTSIQITTGSVRANKINKALAGHYAKAKVEAGRGLWEFRINADQVNDYKIGDQITVALFEPGQMIDVQATSRGKGFAGVIKRHNFATQDASHGNSLSHRAPGSIGQNQSPGRVFKGKKMAGHMGNKRCTVQNQEVVRVDVERNLLLIRGGVPGAPGASVMILPAVKYKSKTEEAK